LIKALVNGASLNLICIIINNINWCRGLYFWTWFFYYPCFLSNWRKYGFSL